METNDYYKNIKICTVFTNKEVKESTIHFKNLTNMLMCSGVEFSFAADAAFSAYQKLYSWGIARELFTYEDKRYKL